MNWGDSSIKKLIQKSSFLVRVFGTGLSLAKARKARNFQTVEELALSQENAPSAHLTVRQIATESGIPKSGVHELIKHDLKLK